LIPCLYVTGRADAMQVSAAWLFVGLRILHSAVHCTFNFVPLRFVLYVAGALTLWFMAIRAATMLLG
jgi:hypothetical protein